MQAPMRVRMQTRALFSQVRARVNEYRERERERGAGRGSERAGNQTDMGSLCSPNNMGYQFDGFISFISDYLYFKAGV